MSEASPDNQRKILAFSAVAEAATGLVLIVAPAIVAALLLGVNLSGVGPVLARCFGIALLSLGLACWPGHARAAGASAALRAMLAYNSLIALYLGYLGTLGHLGGLLLWPAVALHAAVALALIWTSRGKR